MKTYCLDTNTCIYALKGTFPSIERRISQLAPDSIKIPSIVRAELLFGGEKSTRRKRTLEAIGAFLFPYEIVPFDGSAAACYAKIRHQLEKKGEPIGPNDLIVAATVMAAGGVLVTHNVREFGRVAALKVEDWAV